MRNQTENDEGRSILEFLEQSERHYLTPSDGIRLQDPMSLAPEDSILFRVDEITYEDEAPWKEALENVLSATRIPGVNFVYLLQGTGTDVRFYFGLSRDYSSNLESRLMIREIGQSVLKSSMTGNFRGSEVAEVDTSEKDALLSKVKKVTYMSRIEGVAGSIKDDERFQSVDRLVDVMQGEKFCLLIIAKALDAGEIAGLERGICLAYSSLTPHLKYNRQEGTSQGTSRSSSRTTGNSSGTSENRSKSESAQSSESTSSGTNSSTTWGTSKADGKQSSKSKNVNQSTSNAMGEKKSVTNGGGESSSESTSMNTQESNSTTKGENSGTSTTEGSSTTIQTGSGTTKSVNESTAEQTGSSTGASLTVSREYQDRRVQEWIKYCDEVILPRLDYGKGKGTFISAFYVMTDSAGALIKLENTVLSLYSGKQGNRVPLRAFPLKEGDRQREFACQLQMPCAQLAGKPQPGELTARAFLSQMVSVDGSFPLGNWITTNELSMIAGLPRKEVVGLRLRAEVEFGLNCKAPGEASRIPLGKLVQNGREIPAPVYLDKEAMDKHLFITGVTGSGKTTTCQKILRQSKLPFLVVEPAKTEYRIMRNLPECSDLLIFTLGDDMTAPFRLNPFEFLPQENITSHVDMMRASIEAAFDMDAAIPQLIESAIYRCYERYGWDVATNRNRIYEDPFASDVCAFPRWSDLLEVINDVVNEQGFDERLKGEYIGSIRARLQSLTIGGKGAMLDTFRSVDWDALLDQQVIFELENVKNVGDKSLIMGFILSAFNEAVKERYLRQEQRHPHILLVEEAHRLLSRCAPGDSMNKKHGVEMFSDMLAEIRKYGECLIIVDQIPNKMAEDVLKNTNTKIVHRIFAQDDKEAIGNTMALEEEQKQFLSNLATGRAVLFSDNVGQAVQVQIDRDTDTSKNPLSNKELRRRAFEYYLKKCERNIFLPLRRDVSELPEELRECALEFIRTDIPLRIDSEWSEYGWREEYAAPLQALLREGIVSEEDIAGWIVTHCKKYASRLGTGEEAGVRGAVRDFIKAYAVGESEAVMTGFC